jgi:Methyltransferase domain
MPDPATPQFPLVWEFASGVSGWLTEAQAELLWETAEQLPQAPLVVEIGSHQGRSTIMLAAAAASRSGQVVAIDPFVDGRLFGGSGTRELFEQNIAGAGLTDSVELLPEYSTRALPRWTRRIDCLYIDGKHDYWTLSDDLNWSRHMPAGGPVLIHDCFSSIGVTLGILVHVLPSRTLTYERRVGSLALFRVATPTAADRLRIIAEIPWWLRNVAIKVLLRLRLRRVAAGLFGHRSPYDPY